MQKEHNKPILVTGAHRSGTTWVAKMLSLSETKTLIAEEPFNVEASNFGLGGLATQHFTYAPGLDQDEAKRQFEKIYNMETGQIFKRRMLPHYLSFTRNGRLIIKDPIACLSAGWIADNFDIDVVVLARHPCAFTESLRRMGWEPDLSMFTGQPALVEDYLRDLLPLIRSFDTDFDSRCAIAWKIFYLVLNDQIDRHPEWIVKTHEQLSVDPVPEYRNLYEALALPWSEHVENQIQLFTGSENRVRPKGDKQHCLHRDSRANAFRWKDKMALGQIQLFKNLTDPEWTKHYKEMHWSLQERFHSDQVAV